MSDSDIFDEHLQMQAMKPIPMTLQIAAVAVILGVVTLIGSMSALFTMSANSPSLALLVLGPYLLGPLCALYGAIRLLSKPKFKIFQAAIGGSMATLCCMAAFLVQRWFDSQLIRSDEGFTYLVFGFALLVTPLYHRLIDLSFHKQWP